MTFKQLMKETGCPKWPAIWNDLYPIAEANLERGEYRALNEEYYDYLDEKYSIFKKYPVKDTFKLAATKTSGNYNASLFLALMIETIKIREDVYKNLAELTFPENFEGEEKFVFAMLRGLAFLSMADYTASVLECRGVPKEMIYDIVRNFPGGVATHRKCHNGEDGFMDFDWNQRMIDGNLLPVKRLVAEVNSTFRADACAFVSDRGDVVTLAHGAKLHRSGFALGAKGYEDEEGSWIGEIAETEESYIGYPYNAKGFAEKTPVTLPKSKWKKLVSKGDKVVDLHIPGGGGLTPEIVSESLSDINAFLARCYPEYHYEVFQCESWLCDPQLVGLLGEGTNISGFTSRFIPISMADDGSPVMRFVFNITHKNFKLEDLPENTTLLRTLKKHFLSGGHIYGTRGYFLKGDV